MGSEWPECTIDSLKAPFKTAIAMGPFGSRIKAENFVDSGIPIIKGAQLHGTYVLDSGFDFLTKEKAEELKSSQAFRGDLVITHRGTIGQVSIIPDDSKYEKYIVSQSQLKVSLDRKKVNPYFVNYFFKSHLGQHRLLTNASQVGVPAIAKASTSVKSIQVPCPSLKEQNYVVSVLRTLDRKIELNRKMNVTLESMAQALFKSWFVDFDPVIDKALAAGNPIPEPLQKRAEVRRQLGDKRKPLPVDIEKYFPDSFVFSEELGWIPERWEVALLSELLEVKYGKNHKKLDDGKIPVYGSGGLMRRVNKSLYNGESVLIPRKGTLSNILYVDEEFWTVDTMFYTVPKKEYLPKFVFFHLKRLDFASLNVGSAVPSMTTKILNGLKIITPAIELLKEFNSLLTNIFLSIKANNIEINTLSSLRDILLPKLLSGELRVFVPGVFIEEPNRKGNIK